MTKTDTWKKLFVKNNTKLLTLKMPLFFAKMQQLKQMRFLKLFYLYKEDINKFFQ